MFAYIMRRLAVAVPTLLLLIVFSFILMHLAPGGPFTQERELPPQVLANLNAKYGLDDPLWKQIISYIWGIVAHFDFGPSFVYPDRSVNELVAAGFPVTLTYGSLAFIAAVVMGVGLGVVAAIWHNSFLDYLAVGISIGAQVLPNFVMAPILVLIFTLWYGLLPGGGWSFSDPSFWIMPVIALGTSYMASIARITRSSMLEVLGSNHIRTARAKGMPEHRVIIRHALKPAMLPVISYLGPVFVSMITGSVVIDIYFSTGGIGKAFVDSALNRDYAVMMGVTILVGALTIVFNLVVDVLYAWIDPKIRY
ncbi:oligopeptide ABC transporter permease OppB [Paracoccus sp. R12_1]|uniref:oligopeptide ABC transporter permease OppB n=1 Tax=unclassified Paracoccus (in: a-proteobacteria) TaxID=2688777 RepID=UPI001ADD50C0|nr:MULTISPECIES: oligopeptide ABC transporter permease OppB [unclassified Paracoccus (in: a-proteobacteria)]MBO9454287.1 oligopeptide ABC transporter permease OppB [Paracoccus sp. R12_2]MBO9485073.1 oligopeptide ABC transporter permease OppB [Paracoccus sp. R12_1]